VEPEFQNSEYAGHQVGPVGPNEAGNQNFSSLGRMVSPVSVAQILRSTATAREADFFFSQIMFLAIKSPKT
jgi:hypothetical protein